MKDIVIVGAGGLGRGVAWLIEEINQVNNEWNLLGFVDDSDNPDIEELSGHKIIGHIDWLNNKSVYAVLAIANPMVKKKIIENHNDSNLKFPTLIHPTVSIPKNSTIGEGSVIYNGTSIGVNVNVGKHVSINYNVSLGHDASLHDYVTIFPGVNVSGNVTLKDCVSMGTNSAILPGLSVGETSVVGAAALITKDMPGNATIYGMPAQVRKINEE